MLIKTGNKEKHYKIRLSVTWILKSDVFDAKRCFTDVLVKFLSQELEKKIEHSNRTF